MFDWFEKLFGEGKIRVECVLSDGRKCTVKMPYIGDINTMDKEEVLNIAENWVKNEHGFIVVSAKIVGIVEY